MEEKIYEMPDDYKEAMALLLESIELRDTVSESLKHAPPEKVREGRELIALLDKKINQGEAVLANEYEAYQKKCRAEEELDAMTEDAVERMAKVLIHFKYNHPEKLEELRDTVTKGYMPEEEQDFYDRVAVLEATQLRKLVAQVGDTDEDIDRKIKERNVRDAEG